MKKLFLPSLIIFVSITADCKTKAAISKYNFGFEIIENGFPSGWNKNSNPNYLRVLDSTNVKSGKYAVSIEFKKGTAAFDSWTFAIPDN